MKRLVIILTVLAAGVLATASAANAAQIVTASVTCGSTNVTGSFSFSGFTGTNQASEQLVMDATVASTQLATGFGDEWAPLDLTQERPVDGLSHLWRAVARWSAPGGEHVISSDPVSCAPLSPPPTTMTTTPVVTTTTTVATTTTTAAVTTPAPSPKPCNCRQKPKPHPKPKPKKPRHRCDCRVARVILPTASTGVHTFGIVPRVGHAESISVTILEPNGSTVTRSASGDQIRLDLGDHHLWQKPVIYGNYRLFVVLRVREHGRICVCKHVVSFLNRDPH